MSTVDELVALTRQVGMDVGNVRRIVSTTDGDLSGLVVPDATTLVEAINAVYARSGRTGPAGKPGAASVVPGPPGRDGTDGAPGRDGIDGVDGANGTPGRDGAPGATGPAGVTSASASSLAAGSAPTASVSNGVLSLGIPRGNTGAQGTPGTNGTNGAKGDTGATGPVGVTSATANTLSAGSAATASVTNGVLTIGVPIGSQGTAGTNGAQGPAGPSNTAALVKLRTSGNVAVTATSQTVVDSTLDITLNAAIGNLIRVTASGQADNVATALDTSAVIMSNGTAVRGVVGAIVPGWTCRGGDYNALGGVALTIVKTGDLYNGTITLRLTAAIGNSGSTRTIFANTNQPLLFAVEIIAL